MSDDTVNVADEAPDLITPIIACRSWYVGKEQAVPGDESVYQGVHPSDPPWHLWSTGISQGIYWKPGTNEAVCYGGYGMGKNHKAPNPACSCGFYALGTWAELFDRHPSLRPSPKENAFLVYGTVEFFGTVIPGDRGFRAEKAKVRSLLMPAFEPFGDIRRRSRMRKQLRNMQRVVTKTAEAYGVPIVDTLEDLTDPKEVINGYREGTRSNPSGTAASALGSQALQQALAVPSAYIGASSGVMARFTCAKCGGSVSYAGFPVAVHKCPGYRTTVDFSNGSWVVTAD